MSSQDASDVFPLELTGYLTLRWNSTIDSPAYSTFLCRDYHSVQFINSHVHASSPVILLVTAARSIIDLIDAPQSRHGENVNPTSSNPLHTTRGGVDFPTPTLNIIGISP